MMKVSVEWVTPSGWCQRKGDTLMIVSREGVMPL